MPKEIYIAVGSPESERSSVWKFWVQNNEIYILSRMFGRDSKVSLHKSGTCQWSLTDHWVQAEHDRKNADRHMARWHIERPTGTEAQHIFRVHIPVSELRPVQVEEKLAKVRFIPVPEGGASVTLECYITPASDSDPALQSNLNLPIEASFPLAEGRWFVIMSNVSPTAGCDITQLRKAALGEMREYIPQKEHRIAAFTEQAGSTKGLIELCAI